MVILTTFTKTTGFEVRVLKDMQERIIKDFMDVIVMNELRKAPMSIYDVIS